MKRSQQKKFQPKIKKIKDIQKNNSVVLYGRSGTGKTTFAASAPGPILYLDVRDKGTASIRDAKDVDVIEVEDFEDFENTYWWLKEEKRKYKTIIIDTCTQLQNMVIQETVDEKKKKTKGKKAGDWGTMTKAEWGTVASLMKEWLGNYRDLTEEGYQVIFIAQDRTFNIDEEDGVGDLTPSVGPALSPSVATFLNASVDIVGHTFIRERTITKEVKGRKVKRNVIEYCLGVGPSSLYIRKARKPKSTELPEAIVDPEWDDMMEIING